MTSPAGAPRAQALDLRLDVAEVKKELAPPASAADPELERKASEFADMLANVDPAQTATQQERKAAVERAGLGLQRESGQRSRMLQQPIHQLAQRGEDGGEVGRALIDLKIQVEELDPNQMDFSPGWLSRMTGALPFVGTPLKRYFSQYESAQVVIDAIIRSLEKGRDQLSRDNVTLAEDQKLMRDLTLKLDKQVQLLRLIDQKLQYKLDREIPADDARHAFISDELLFPLRQRIQDLQQQLAINQQGVLAIELVVRNNQELIRGVDRAINVTVGALQVAVTVALALAHQKIVLDKVNALNTTTSDLIAGTARRLRQQGTEIHRQASSATLDMEALKSAFVDLNQAMDEISSFRRDALPQMAGTILELDQLTRQGEEAMRKMEQGNRALPGLNLDAI
jgi:uncharacterized protein YaaN involved in tellurite resistance